MSNHRISNELENQLISLISTNYSDFGPTLATEKLFEIHNIKISKETIRKLMIKSGLWQAKSRKRKKVFYRDEELKFVDIKVHQPQ